MDLSAFARRLASHRKEESGISHDAAVLIPLVEGTQGLEVLLEVRSLTLDVQPGEVCLPGGGVEPGEDPCDAAIRETCEELLVSAEQITILGAMGMERGPGGRTLHVFVGTIEGYGGTFSADEVDHTFTLPVEWLATHEPTVYDVRMQPVYPDDFPWDLVPGGRAYAWRSQINSVPFYPQTDPVVWGVTARVLMRFSRLWR